MEKSVIYRDRQEFQATDANNTQAWMDEAQRNFIMDGITSQRQIVGLAVTVRSATEIDIAPGRLYDGTNGKVFFLGTVFTASILAMLPLQDFKWLAVSVYGQEEDTDIQPRDFLIDLQTGQTQPEAVAMQRRRVIISHIAQGLESPTPERPEPPTGYTLIAQVKLSPSGIEEIVLATSRQLPNLHQLTGRVTSVEGWIATTEPRIAHIVSDLAGLGEAVASRASISHLRKLAQDMAAVKERLQIPEGAVFYGADHFLNEDESDPDAVGYSARIQEGVRAAFAAQDTVEMAMLNPVDPAAKVGSDGFLLPFYNEYTRLKMENKTGELTLNSYQYQTQAVVQRTMSRERVQYGETRLYSTGSEFWHSHQYDAASGILSVGGETWEVDPADRNIGTGGGTYTLRVREIWKSSYNETYWDVDPVDHTVNGSILAQTILMAQTGWMTSIDLYFTNVNPSGGLTLMLADASLGQPDLNNLILKMDFANGALNTGWCRLTFTRPVFVESGRRYAIVLATGSQHRVGYTNGTEYTQGILLYAQDGAFFNEASDRDLMMRLQFAQFPTPRTVVQMEPLQLSGGIGDLDMLYEGVTPDGCELFFEYQVAGVWYPIKAKTAENLATQPALLPIRAVFVGTTDLMPGLKLPDSQVIVSRVGTSFTHFSTTRTLGTASDNIVVRVLLEDFDETPHNAGCQLIIDGTPESASSTKDEIVDFRSLWREWTFNLGATTSDYVIKLTGSTTTWRQAFHIAERYDTAL